MGTITRYGVLTIVDGALSAKFVGGEGAQAMGFQLEHHLRDTFGTELAR